MTKYICSEALDNNCGHESCPGFLSHDRSESCNINEHRNCYNTWSRWNEPIPVTCVEVPIQ